VDLSSLVTIGPDSMTPMQSFYFRTGINGTPCVQAPSLLYVQGPNNVPVDIQVFQKNVRIESTIIFRSLPPGDTLGTQLEIIVLSGLGKLFDGDYRATAVVHRFDPGEGLRSEFPCERPGIGRP